LLINNFDAGATANKENGTEHPNSAGKATFADHGVTPWGNRLLTLCRYSRKPWLS
jgi:hypothetical protein